jgi:single-strand DNA-binding protein
MFQKIVIVGNLGRDPELRYTSAGKAACSFSVATTKTWYDTNTNQKKSKTVWFDVSVWSGQAKACHEYLRKGSQVLVEGEMDIPYAYQRQDGTMAAQLKLTAQSIKFLNSASSNNGPVQPPTDNSFGGDLDFEIEDIPF